MRIFLILILLICVQGHAIEPKKIVIFGAGYVGLVTGSCFSQFGHQITFIDTNAEKVTLLKRRQMPISEPQLEEIFCRGMDQGLIVVKEQLSQEIQDADLVFIAVATPTNEAGEPQLQAVQAVLAQFVSNLDHRDKQLIVSLRSTVLPDAFRQLQQFCDGRISLVMNPEFLRESTAVQDFFHPPFAVAGGADSEAVKAVLDLYEEITPKRYAVNGEAACLLKYACNAFHAAKIAFTNEISTICDGLEINPVEVMDIFAQDTHLNASAAYLKPGFSFGGSCLAKDLRALCSFHQSRGESLPLLDAILPSNQCRFQRAVETILKGNHRQLAVIGMSFKKGSDDVRDSPYVDLIETLLYNGISLKIYDPDIDFDKLKISNREWFEKRFSSLMPMMCEDLESTLAGCDGVVLCKDFLDGSQLQEIKNVYDLGYFMARKNRAQHASFEN